MFYVFLGMTLIFALLFYLKPLFISLIFGGILIVITNRFAFIFNRLTRKYSRFEKKIIAGIVFVFLSLFFLLFLYIQASHAVTFVRDLFSLTTEYQEASGSLLPVIEEAFSNKSIFGVDFAFLKNLFKLILMSSGSLIASVQSSVSLFPSIFVTSLFTIPFMFLFYYTQKRRVIRCTNSALPYSYRQPFWIMISSIVRDLNLFMTLKIIEIIILSLLYSIGFYFAGTPHWLVLGMFLSLFSTVPYVGFFFGSVPVCILAYVLNPQSVIYVIFTIIAVQFIDIFFILPNMLSKTIRIHPLVCVILSLMAWQLFGIIGLIITVPVYLVYKIVLTACYNQLVLHFPERLPT